MKISGKSLLDSLNIITKEICAAAAKTMWFFTAIYVYQRPQITSGCQGVFGVSWTSGKQQLYVTQNNQVGQHELEAYNAFCVPLAIFASQSCNVESAGVSEEFRLSVILVVCQLRFGKAR